MKNSTRSKVFPKKGHFGFKRPVFFEPVKDDTDTEKEDNQASEPEESPPPQKISLQLLSFNISTELPSFPDDTQQSPSFDWIDNDSDKFEFEINDSLLHFGDSDIADSLNDFYVKFDPTF